MLLSTIISIYRYSSYIYTAYIIYNNYKKITYYTNYRKKYFI